LLIVVVSAGVRNVEGNMNKQQHSSNNLVLGAPAGWDQEQLPCNALPVTRIVWDGLPAVVSYWKPTPVALSVVGSTMPPVALFVETTL
jgi:hypothetical protein